MPKCKSCGAEIVWIKTAAGRSMPCDAKIVLFDGSKDGKEVFITLGGNMVRGAYPQENNLVADPRKGYIPHWATCPSAKQHKKEKSGSEASAE